MFTCSTRCYLTQRGSVFARAISQLAVLSVTAVRCLSDTLTFAPSTKDATELGSCQVSCLVMNSLAGAGIETIG